MKKSPGASIAIVRCYGGRDESRIKQHAQPSTMF